MYVAGFKFSHDGNEVLRIYVVPGHVSLSMYIGGQGLCNHLYMLVCCLKIQGSSHEAKNYPHAGNAECNEQQSE